MACTTISLFLLFLNVFATVSAQQTQPTINLGSQLFPATEPTSWLSPSRLYAFGFYKQGDGFAVGIWLNQTPEKTVVWTANRDDKPVSNETILLLSKEGSLVLRNRGQDTQITNASSSASYASMLNSGNFVLYNAISEVIWESFKHPTDTILANMTLSAQNQLFSSASITNHSTGRFRLKNQDDGNLVLYPIQTTDIAENAYWAAGIFAQGYRTTLALEQDGHMYLFRENGTIVMNFTEGWSSSSNQTVVYRATIDFDGIFRLYSHSFESNGSHSKVIRWSAKDDQCLVKGICGFNSYCSSENNRTDCLCLPGFDFVDPNQRFQGCERNFTEQSCSGRTENLTYTMKTMENMILEDDPYSILSLVNEIDCGSGCLSDCNCHAALLKNGRCSKLKLPLRYGRQGTDNSTVIFIKVGDGTLGSPNNTFPTSTAMMRSKKEIRMDILLVSIILVTCSVIVIIISCLLIYRYKRRYEKVQQNENFGLTEEIALKSFSYDELKRATGNFKEEVGNGAFGTVYKGTLSKGQRAIAVKTLTKMIKEGEKEFQREMKAIGRTHHRNLVKLLGFCSEGSNRLLVYEFMKNGSLANLLFKDCIVPPNWNERMRIALDVARGILYLHEDCEPHIIHCDIKPENILMDDFWTAKISDFGLAKLLMPNQTRTFTGPRGTRGYVAPEWHRNVPITVKADVYSYGIVLLEIVCCRKNLDLEVEESGIILSDWVYSIFVTGQLDKLMVGEDVEKATMDRMVKVGLWCIQSEPALRPSMKNVILLLEGHIDIPIPPCPTSNNL